MLKTGEMLKMLKFVFEKVLKTGEMLKMLKMLKFFGETSDVKVCNLRFPQPSFHLFLHISPQFISYPFPFL